MFTKIENKINKMSDREYISKYMLFLWLYCLLIAIYFTYPSISIEFSPYDTTPNIFLYLLMNSMIPLMEIAYQLPSLIIFSVLFIMPILLLLADIAKYKFNINNKFTKNLRLLLSTYIVVIYIYTAIISIILILLIITSYFS